MTTRHSDVATQGGAIGKPALVVLAVMAMVGAWLLLDEDAPRPASRLVTVRLALFERR